MMQPDFTKTKIFVRPGSTDMRKQINGLAMLVNEGMNLNPLGGSLFLFCNRDRRILKALYWDTTGFALWHKKLEKEKFPWPEDETEARQINTAELQMLLRGIDFWRAHKKLFYDSVG